jgi:superfamily I DNA and RNA helicase
MVEVKTPRTGALKVQVEDIDRRIVSISQVVEALQRDIEEIRNGMETLQELPNKAAKEPDTDKVAVLEQYIKMFNTFLNSSMITNTVDPSAEASLNEVIDKL